MAAAGGAPTARRVEGKMFWIELGEGFAAVDVGACRGKPRKGFAGRRDEKT